MQKHTLTNKPLRILVIGAGVVGSLYAAKLAKGTNDVAVLARGDRLAQLRRNGLQLEDRLTGERWTGNARIIGNVPAEDAFDLVLVSVRHNQLEGVLQLVNTCTAPLVLFLLNNPHAEYLEKTIGHRAVFGFPGAGGILQDGIVRYAMIAEQPTTLGESDGQISPRVASLAALLRRTGFEVAISRAMPAWLKTHAIFITAICGALYGVDCSATKLATNCTALNQFIEGTRAGFGSLPSVGVKVVPFKLRLLFVFMPTWFARRYWQRYFASTMGELVFAAHARAASDEIVGLVHECRALLALQGIPVQLEKLWRQVEDYNNRHSAP
jgi:2-dehydropantoate 2-reductase